MKAFGVARSEQRDAALRGQSKPRNQPQQGRLPGAVVADQAVDMALLQAQVDAIQGSDGPIPPAIAFDQPLGFKYGHPGTLPSSKVPPFKNEDGQERADHDISGAHGTIPDQLCRWAARRHQAACILISDAVVVGDHDKGIKHI